MLGNLCTNMCVLLYTVLCKDLKQAVGSKDYLVTADKVIADKQAKLGGLSPLIV